MNQGGMQSGMGGMIESQSNTATVYVCGSNYIIINIFRLRK